MEKSDFAAPTTPPELLELHFNESTFGLAEFSAVLDAHFEGRKGLRCLEVGSGAAVLLTRMKDRYPQHSWEGIEPIGQGFSRFEVSLDAIVKRHDLAIHRTTFEAFEAKEPFDFIFSLNVLEHVDSWRDCLSKAHAILRPGGLAVFLCPNYSFPYEPHYALPIVINKSITHRIFRRSIANYDRRHNTKQLWSSLNFIKKREVARFCRERGIKLRFDEAIMTRMVEKLWTDPAFAERQSVMAVPAKLLHRIGATRLVQSFPLNRLSPYSKIILEK
jgi:SAM-dependent methyltransferase